MRCSPVTTFTFDLTDDQRQLCAWVAEQASIGVHRIWYVDLKAAMGIKHDRDITRLLRQIRERLDTIHTMVHSPIVNTNHPYFDLHRDADWIWSDYCRAEREERGVDLDEQDAEDILGLFRSERECMTCTV